MDLRQIALSGLPFLLVLLLLVEARAHEQSQPPQTPIIPSRGHPTRPIKITMDELHRHGGIPPGWVFRLPQGDPQVGREVFAKLECHQCHVIRGESFSQPAQPSDATGPELTGMGSHHPAEYFTESIVNPNAVIVAGPGYTDADGLSIMPDYRESLTVAELIDLVAYLKNLQGGNMQAGMAAHHGRHGHGTPGLLVDTNVGPYRARLMYHEGHRRSHSGHGGVPSARHKVKHLVAFITDVKTGETIPYLPVALTMRIAKAAQRTLTLKPMLDGSGFHYGADVILPSKPAEIILSIGAITVQSMATATGRYSTPQEVSFRWTPHPHNDPAQGAHMPASQGKTHKPSAP